MKTRIFAVFLTIALSLSACSPNSRAADPPPLSKTDASKIIGFMGYTNITVAAIIQGVGGEAGKGSFSSSAVAMVIACGEYNGEPNTIKETLYYDKEIGWFTYLIDERRKSVFLWTVNGVSETTSKNTPKKQDAVTSNSQTPNPFERRQVNLEKFLPFGLCRVFRER